MATAARSSTPASTGPSRCWSLVPRPAVLGYRAGRTSLLWTGTQYAVLYQVNASHGVHLRLRLIDAAGPTVSEPFELTPEYDGYENASRNGRLVWANGEFRLFWTTENQTIWMRRVSAEGKLLSEPTPAVQNVGVHAYLGTVLPHDSGFSLLWKDDRSQEYFYLWYFVQIDDTGGELAPHALVSPGADTTRDGAALIAQDDGFSLVWNYRQAVAPDSVLLSNFGPDGVLKAPPTELYRAENAILSYFGSPAAPWHGGALAAIWDMDLGVMLIDTQNPAADAPVVLEADEVTGRALVAVSEVTAPQTLAMIYAAGEYRPTNPSPTELHFTTVDPSTWTAAQRVQLNKLTKVPGSCVQRWDIVGSTNGFGVTWVRGCAATERTLFFAQMPPTVTPER